MNSEGNYGLDFLGYTSHDGEVFFEPDEDGPIVGEMPTDFLVDTQSQSALKAIQSSGILNITLGKVTDRSKAMERLHDFFKQNCPNAQFTVEPAQEASSMVVRHPHETQLESDESITQLLFKLGVTPPPKFEEFIQALKNEMPILYAQYKMNLQYAIHIGGLEDNLDARSNNNEVLRQVYQNLPEALKQHIGELRISRFTYLHPMFADIGHQHRQLLGWETKNPHHQDIVIEFPDAVTKNSFLTALKQLSDHEFSGIVMHAGAQRTPEQIQLQKLVNAHFPIIKSVTRGIQAVKDNAAAPNALYFTQNDFLALFQLIEQKQQQQIQQTADGRQFLDGMRAITDGIVSSELPEQQAKATSVMDEQSLRTAPKPPSPTVSHVQTTPTHNAEVKDKLQGIKHSKDDTSVQEEQLSALIDSIKGATKQFSKTRKNVLGAFLGVRALHQEKHQEYVKALSNLQQLPFHDKLQQFKEITKTYVEYLSDNKSVRYLTQMRALLGMKEKSPKDAWKEKATAVNSCIQKQISPPPSTDISLP